MLKGLKMSALAQKWIFYRSEVIGNGGPHRIEVLSFGNAKIYQPIELKDEMKKKTHSFKSFLQIFLFISRPSKSNSMESPLCIMFWPVKYTLKFQRRHFQAC